MIAVRQGASDVQGQVGGALPAIGQFMSRMVYTSCYGLSYGVVFPVMLVVRIIPKDNAMVHGFVDGAIAAREQVEGWGMETMEEDLHADEASAAESDGEAESDDSHDATANHRRRSTRRAAKPKTASRSTRKR